MMSMAAYELLLCNCGHKYPEYTTCFFFIYFHPLFYDTSNGLSAFFLIKLFIHHLNARLEEMEDNKEYRSWGHKFQEHMTGMAAL